MQVTKYTGTVDQLTNDWNYEHIQKDVDEAFRLNSIANEAELQAKIDSGEYQAEMEAMGFIDVRPKSFFNKVGQFAIGRFKWKNTQLASKISTERRTWLLRYIFPAKPTQ
jgi:hypothetical protein